MPDPLERVEVAPAVRSRLEHVFRHPLRRGDVNPLYFLLLRWHARRLAEPKSA